jgi:hypothetical protein
MTNAIGTGQDPALQPAAAAARQIDQAPEAANSALDAQALQGRDAVQPTSESAPAPDASSSPAGGHVDRTA